MRATPIIVTLVLLAGCQRGPRAVPPSPPAPTAPASTPAAVASAPAPDEAARLGPLEAQAAAATRDADHGRLLDLAAQARRLVLPREADRARRDGLATQWEAQAETIRDAVHRFLFVELEPLGERRAALLARTDAGERPAIVEAARALAEHAHAARTPPRLRATVEQPSGKDPASGLLVRPSAENLKALPLWRTLFDRAYNDRLCELARGGQ